MKPAWKNELNREQLLAVTHEGNPLLVLAGAGSGKTRVLTYRAFWLIKNKGIDPKKIVLLTFTNKAAQEMSGRVRELLTQKPPGVDSKLGFAGTFHGFCVRLLRIYGQAVGVKKGFVIYDTADQRQVMKKALTNLDQENTPKKVRMYLAIISKYKNNLVSIKDTKGLTAIWQEYQRLLNKFNALDFDDLLTKCVDLLKVTEVRHKVHQRFDWILVDEYQDTNKAQFELTRLLVNNPSRLMVVGDASQAIYSFRGADFRNLELLNRYFSNLKVVELTENYRSTQNILDAAHEVISNNTGHPALKLVTRENEGDKIIIFEGLDGRAEAKFVVDNCTTAIEKEKSVAVLYRTNAQSRILEEELIRVGITYRLVGGVRFYERAEIKDLLAYLKVIANKNDAVAWDRIEKLGKRRRSNFETWFNTEFNNKLTTVELIKKILEITKYLEKFDKKNEEDLGRLENIDELIAVASEFPKVEPFLESVALIQAEDLADQLQPKKTQVTLMTIHSAKGLEFDNVFVVGLEEGLLPHSRSLLEKNDLEEERRLLYVAITRARQRLFLSFAGLRFLYGGRNNQTPSRFLSEISGRLIMTERKVIPDWQMEKETADDFSEIDSW
ncbi:ATP-dependent helicase [Patescibacteria group bacterium]|nr:ATP-dependent helicase [Patescibacteria group bacterium]MBU1256360.1 ATP-dependent helicase [Patescibacteria group bacterium]MBU1457737.1 ATP-dependent helicase [Patescibacteria group bacterium]